MRGRGHQTPTDWDSQRRPLWKHRCNKGARRVAATKNEQRDSRRRAMAASGAGLKGKRQEARGKKQEGEREARLWSCTYLIVMVVLDARNSGAGDSGTRYAAIRVTASCNCVHAGFRVLRAQIVTNEKSAMITGRLAFCCERRWKKIKEGGLSTC